MPSRSLHHRETGEEGEQPESVCPADPDIPGAGLDPARQKLLH